MLKKIKIAYDCRHLQKPNLDDGASRYSFELLNAIAAYGTLLELFFLGYKDDLAGTKLGELAAKKGEFVGVFKRRGPTMLNYSLTQAMFPRVLRAKGVDLFHALFQTEVLALTEVPQIATVHDPGPYYSYSDEVRGKIEEAAGICVKNRFQDRLRFKFIKKAEAVLADSEFTRKRLVELDFARPEKITVVYPGLAPCAEQVTAGEDIFVRYGIARPYVFMVGRIQPYKNILGAIKAFKILTDRGLFDGMLVAAGTAKGADGKNYLDQCLKQAEIYGLAGKVRFLGYVPDSHLQTFYSKAAVFLQASFLEGFGFPPLEAARAGTPVVVSEICSLPEIIPQAVKVSPFSPEDIAGGMSAALKSVRCEKAKWPDWAQTAKKVVEIYRAVENRSK
ncbi:MAG TPA: hypothetical protein DCL44_11070 [Elusimicrobia bacterium]|nr:hypothetical protein [Elusimicrobiota bacterium]